MTDKNSESNADASDENKEDLSDLEEERPPGARDTEELSLDQIQELLKKSSETE